MKASGTPKTKNKIQAVRRARALRGNLLSGHLGSFQAGRGRFRVLPWAGGRDAPSGVKPVLGVPLSYRDDPTAATITWYTAAAATSRAEWGRSVGPPYPFHKAGDD